MKRVKKQLVPEPSQRQMQILEFMTVIKTVVIGILVATALKKKLETRQLKVNALVCFFLLFCQFCFLNCTVQYIFAGNTNPGA